LHFLGLVPEEGRGKSTKPRQAKPHGGAGKFHIAHILLTQGQGRGPGADELGPPKVRNRKEHQNHADVNQLALAYLLLKRIGHGE